MRILFANPSYLWLLFSIPLLFIVHFLTLKTAKGKVMEFANFGALERVAKNIGVSKNLGLLWTRTFTLFFVIFAVSAPIVEYMGMTNNFDLILAIDTSSSMLATDLLPDRITAAKQEALNLIDTLPRSKIGVVVFAGSSMVEQVLTNDRDLVKSVINNIDIMPMGGTDIGEAIMTSTNILLTTDNPRVVVLMTDGRSNVGTDSLDGAAYAVENSVVVHTIGIGSEEGGTIEYLNVTLTLDEDLLEEVSNITSGKFYRVKSKEELNQAYADIKSASMQKIRFELTSLSIGLVLLFLLLEWVLLNTRYRILP